MEADSIKDSNRYIVGEKHLGGIQPSDRSEMWRDVHLKKGADIEGGIFGKSLRVHDSNIRVSETVCVKNGINLEAKGGRADAIMFGSVVIAGESIINSSISPIVRFCSDVYCGSVNLYNTIIYGNLYAEQVKLNNCIVLGGVYSSRLHIEHCALGTFAAETVALKDVSLLSLFAISGSDFSIPQGELRCLAFHNIFRNGPEGKSVAIALDDKDIHKLKADDPMQPSKYILSVSERLVNVSNILGTYENNLKMFKSLAASGSRKDGMGQSTGLEEELWGVVKDPPEVIEKEERAPISN
jgi:hypothetical protein